MSIVISASYDADLLSYVAQLLPFQYNGDVHYWAAVMVQTKQNREIETQQIQSFLGLTTGETKFMSFPFGQGGAGFKFEPVIGSPY
eukprot:COSAG04_NODE_22765_length_349_cov_0.956000_2_plen_85_part_01